MKARGDMRVRRSSGWSWRRVEAREEEEAAMETLEDEEGRLVVVRRMEAGGGDWRMLVKTVLRAARKVPRRVRMRPHVVK